MDTIYISKIDTITDTLVDTVYVAIGAGNIVQPSLSWWEESWVWSILIVIIAALGAYASLKSIYVSREIRKADEKWQINKMWSDLIDSSIAVWTKIEYGYNIWLQEKVRGKIPENKRPPKYISELLDRGGIPAGICSINSIQEYWKDLSDDSNQNVVWLQEFFSRVHPFRAPIASIIFESKFDRSAEWEKFNKARSALASALNGWAESISIEYLTQRFRDERIQVLLFVWLELSFANYIGKRWFPRPHLFNLGKRIDESKST